MMTPRNIKLFHVAGFFITLRFFAAIQIIYFVYITKSYALAMSLYSAATIAQALLEIPTGIFSDKVGRRVTTISSAFLAFLSVLFYAIGISYWFLFAGSVMAGLSWALGSGNNDAFRFDSLKELGRQNEYAKYTGRQGSIEQIGFGIAAFVGGFIATKSFVLAMWLSVATQLIAFVCTLFMKEPTVTTKSELNPYAHLKESIRAFRKNPKLRTLLTADTLEGSIGESAYQFSPAFMQLLWPLWAIGVLRAVTNLVGALSFYISDKAIKRFTAVKALVSGLVFNRVVNLVAYAFPTVFSPILLGSTTITYGVTQVATDSLYQNEFTDHQRATMGSLSSIVTSLGFAILSVALGYVADKIGSRNVLLIAEISLVPVLLIYWRLFKHEAKQ